MRNLLLFLTTNPNLIIESPMVPRLLNAISQSPASFSKMNILDVDEDIKDEHCFSVKDQTCIDNGFIHLTKTIKSPCAWEKAFYYIKSQQLLLAFDKFYIIEDDVFFDFAGIENLINYFSAKDFDLAACEIETRMQCLDWLHWDAISDDSYFSEEDLCRSFNPICILSNRLVSDVFQYQEKFKTFLYHEVLFASISKLKDYSTLDFKQHSFFKNIFRNFRYRPLLVQAEINEINHISHPYKIYQPTGKDKQVWANNLKIAIPQILSIVPKKDSFILIDEGKFDSQDIFEDRHIIRFNEHNGYYGGPPEDDFSAIQELERLLKTCAKFIVISWPAFWWLQYYEEWHQYLRTNFPCILENVRLIIFDLHQKFEVPKQGTHI